jgi:hypothetical protein
MLGSRDRERRPGGVLVVLLVYCGYHLCRLLFPARVG